MVKVCTHSNLDELKPIMIDKSINVRKNEHFRFIHLDLELKSIWYFSTTAPVFGAHFMKKQNRISL